MKKQHFRALVKRYLIIFIFLIILTGIFFSSIKPSYIGRMVGQGGNVTHVDLMISPDLWHGLYGNLIYFNGSANVYMLITDPDVRTYDLDLTKCYTTEIYATTLSSIIWPLVEPAHPTDLDNMLGLTNISPLSGSYNFKDIRVFNVNSRNMPLYSTTTKSLNGEYDLGLLKEGSNIIFVSHPRKNALSFDGTLSDYQMMLPIPSGFSETYYFYEDPYDYAICNNLLYLNDPPVLSISSQIDGYFGTRLTESFYATDSNNDYLKLSILPDINEINFDFKYDALRSRYQGTINFTPKKTGIYHTNFILTDGLATVNERVYFDIGYCGDFDSGGDPRCQSRFEDCETCAEDCGVCPDSRRKIVILKNGSVCLDKDNKLYSFRVNTGVNQKYFDGILVSEPISQVKLQIFELDKHEKWHLINEKTTDNLGETIFSPKHTGEFKVIGTKDGFYTSFLYFDVVDCPSIDDLSIITPSDKDLDNETIPPVIEKPSGEVKIDRLPSKWLLLLFYLILIIIGIVTMHYIHDKHDQIKDRRIKNLSKVVLKKRKNI